MKKKIIAACMAMAIFSFPGWGQASESGQASEGAGTQTRILSREERKSPGVTIVVTDPGQRASVRAKQAKDGQAGDKRSETREEAEKQKELQRSSGGWKRKRRRPKRPWPGKTAAGLSRDCRP